MYIKGAECHCLTRRGMTSAFLPVPDTCRVRGALSRDVFIGCLAVFQACCSGNKASYSCATNPLEGQSLEQTGFAGYPRYVSNKGCLCRGAVYGIPEGARDNHGNPWLD